MLSAFLDTWLYTRINYLTRIYLFEHMDIEVFWNTKVSKLFIQVLLLNLSEDTAPL